MFTTAIDDKITNGSVLLEDTGENGDCVKFITAIVKTVERRTKTMIYPATITGQTNTEKIRSPNNRKTEFGCKSRISSSY